MSEKKDKKEKLVTPVGFAKWAHLSQPKPSFDEKGKPKYQIDVCFSDSDPAWKEWGARLRAELNKLPYSMDKNTGNAKPHVMPIKKELDQDDKPTGRFYVTFKTGEQYKPAVFDKYGKPFPEDVLIGNESRVKVNYVTVPYEGFGGGLALYLNAVQVIELVEYKSRSADSYGFDSEAEPESKTAEAAPAAPAQITDPNHPDYLPF